MEGSSDDGRREEAAAEESSTEEAENSNDSDASESEVSDKIQSALSNIRLLWETHFMHVSTSLKLIPDVCLPVNVISLRHSL